MRTTLANLALYQAGWFACVVGAAHGWPVAGAMVALALAGVHLVLARCPVRELAVMAASAFAGAVADSAQVRLGLLAFTAGALTPGFATPWIVVMWLQFATTFHFALRWLMLRPWLAAPLGAIGGPLAFETGRRLGAVTFPAGAPAAFAGLALVWGTVLPLLLVVARRVDPPVAARRYRGLSS